MDQFDVFPAVFSPQRRDDLKPDVERWIGWRGIWEAAYVIEEGEYAGQFACVVSPDQNGPGSEVFVWTPECDLAHIGEPSLGEFLAAGSSAIRASMDFEKAMRSVRSTVGADPAEMERLSQRIVLEHDDGPAAETEEHGRTIRWRLPAE